MNMINDKNIECSCPCGDCGLWCCKELECVVNCNEAWGSESKNKVSTMFDSNTGWSLPSNEVRINETNPNKSVEDVRDINKECPCHCHRCISVSCASYTVCKYCNESSSEYNFVRVGESKPPLEYETAVGSTQPKETSGWITIEGLVQDLEVGNIDDEESFSKWKEDLETLIAQERKAERERVFEEVLHAISFLHPEDRKTDEILIILEKLKEEVEVE